MGHEFDHGYSGHHCGRFMNWRMYVCNMFVLPNLIQKLLNEKGKKVTYRLVSLMPVIHSFVVACPGTHPYACAKGLKCSKSPWKPKSGNVADCDGKKIKAGNENYMILSDFTKVFL